MASRTLAKELGYWVLDGWNAAYDLHVWGFHEGKYAINHVKDAAILNENTIHTLIHDSLFYVIIHNINNEVAEAGKTHNVLKYDVPKT
jgi:hypothetical protein